MTVSNHTRQDVSETTNYQPLVRLSNSRFDPYNLVELYFFKLLPPEELRETKEPIFVYYNNRRLFLNVPSGERMGILMFMLLVSIRGARICQTKLASVMPSSLVSIIH